LSVGRGWRNNMDTAILGLIDSWVVFLWPAVSFLLG
jgi:hypothetical protein